MSSHDWLEGLATLTSDAVLITVLETKGSIPREVGTKMVVSKTEIQGTIGGGNLEYQCISLATKRLSHSNKLNWVRDIQRFPLSARIGQCCGGVVVVMLEYIEVRDISENTSWLQQLNTASSEQQDALLVTPLDPTQCKFLLNKDGENSQLFPQQLRDKCQRLTVNLLASPTMKSDLLTEITDNDKTANYFFEKHSPSRFHIMLFGAGHVGRALVKALADIDCSISWVDSREDQFPEKLPAHTRRITSEYPEDEVVTAPANTCFVIMTHNHQLDQNLCGAVLERDDFRFCGLIGSMTKKRKFEHRLRAQGVNESKIDKLKCPIGISGISGKEPAVIAVSVAAELLALN